MQSTEFSLMLSPKLPQAGGQPAATTTSPAAVAEGAFWLNLAAQLAALEDHPTTAMDAEQVADDLLAQLAAELGLEESTLSAGGLSADDLITMIEGQAAGLHPTALAAAIQTETGVPADLQVLSEQIAEVVQTQLLPGADVEALSEQIAEVLQTQSLPGADIEALSARIAGVVQAQSLPAADLAALSEQIAEVLQAQSLHEANIAALSEQIAEVLQAQSLPATDIEALSERIAEVLQTQSLPGADIEALSARIAEVVQTQLLPGADVAALSAQIAEVVQAQSLPAADLKALSVRIAEVLQSQSLPAADLKTLSTWIAEALQSQADVKTLSTRIAEALQARQLDGVRTELANASTRLSETNQATSTSTESRFSPLLGHALASPPTAPNPLFNLDVPVRQPGWDRAVSERVQWMVNQKVQLAELKLNPPHLGQLEVRVRMEGERAHVHFIAPLATVREALELALPRLREMLADAEMSLGDVTVSQQGAEQQGGTNDQARKAAAGSPDGLTADATEGDNETVLPAPPVSAQGLIDAYA